jgi:glutamyl-Q tRNA(Asp) synthetase
MSSVVGRFAPSPTGPLHFGSLVAAVASYLDARARGGRWLVRMEDVDTPRCVPGADAEILRTLERFGLTWDGEVMYQTTRIDAYREALDKLRAYPCSCSRKDAGDVYPGTCRLGVREPGRPLAWRVRVEDIDIGFDDRAHGRFSQNLTRDVGDFVVLRADGLFAYQLAVVVDDAAQGVTDIVRGADLLDSTPRQIWLQRLLGYPEPRYLHVPVVTNAAGEKLSKQTLAPALEAGHEDEDLRASLRFLGQPEPPPEAEILTWAVERWDTHALIPSPLNRHRRYIVDR